MKYCIKPENSDEKLYGDSFEEIAKDNDLTKIGNHYFVKANKKEEKKEKKDKKFSHMDF